MRGHSEITQLNTSLLGDENVGGLDVSVDDSSLVHVLDSDEQFTCDDAEVSFFDTACLHESAHTASSTVLHDDPQTRAVEIRAMVAGDVFCVGELELAQQLNLMLDLLDVVLCRV